MASFAKLDGDNKVVAVHSLHDNECPTEADGINFLKKIHKTGDIWRQTFHDGTRKNYAGIGFFYDETRDAFLPLKPFPSWRLNEATCKWEAPTPKPAGPYKWDEDTQAWVSY